MVRRDSSGGSSDRTRDTEPVVRERFDWSETPPSLGIVLTLSKLGEDDPLESAEGRPAPLNDYVDPDALDALFSGGADDALSVGVSVDDFEIHVAGDEIAVYRPMY